MRFRLCQRVGLGDVHESNEDTAESDHAVVRVMVRVIGLADPGVEREALRCCRGGALAEDPSPVVPPS